MARMGYRGRLEIPKRCMSEFAVGARNATHELTVAVHYESCRGQVGGWRAVIARGGSG